MIRVFLDASVLFAASFSKTGASRRLFREALRGGIRIVYSHHVLEETERNLARKASKALPAFHELCKLVDAEVVEKPTLGELNKAADYIHLKDAPIAAAAVKAKVDYLATLDRKHFIDDPDVAIRSGLRIGTPGSALAWVQERLAKG
jgi:predicted nucleic acid-binding protein